MLGPFFKRVSKDVFGFLAKDPGDGCLRLVEHFSMEAVKAAGSTGFPTVAQSQDEPDFADQAIVYFPELVNSPTSENMSLLFEVP